MSAKAIEAVRTLKDIQSIFSNILSASEKYKDVQAYVIWRLAQLADNPDLYHHYIIDEANILRFKTREAALPSDSQILACVLTALMDQCAAS